MHKMFAICGTFGKTMQKAFIIESFGGLPKHSYICKYPYILYIYIYTYVCVCLFAIVLNLQWSIPLEAAVQI